MKTRMRLSLWLFAVVARCVNAAGYDVAAYVWPAYQPEPRWAELGLFPAGKGEWQSVWEAQPKWVGHDQPRRPLWGYGNESDPAVVAQKIDAAVAHGVNVFIYDWYWYGGRPFLEDGLDKGFLGAPNNGRMKFFIMWANHNVTKLWDSAAADKEWDKAIWPGAVSEREFPVLVRRWIDRYFTRPNYYRIGGKPVLMIYELKTFLDGIGGRDAAQRALAYLRRACEEAGLGGVYLMACDYALAKSDLAGLGVEGATIYNFVHWAGDGMCDYASWADRAQQRYGRAQAELGLKDYFAHVSVGWDTNPRYPATTVMGTVTNATPAAFARALEKAKAWTDAHARPGAPKLITVNSWNEWTEGSYLEPDEKFGFGYLEAVRKTFGGAAPARRPAAAAWIERRPVPVADVSAWSRGNGVWPTLSTSGDVLRVDFKMGREPWANVRHALALPSNAVALAWKELALTPTTGSRTLWLREADGDAWFHEQPRAKGAVGVWRDDVVELGALAFHADGNGRREMDRVNRLDMGFNNGDQSVLLRDLQVWVRATKPAAPSASATPLDPSVRIAVLECGAETAHVRRVLNAAGLAARRVTPDELARPERFAKASCDLLVIPCSPFFPVEAVPNFKRFLKDGGAFFAFGGYAFDQLSLTPQVTPDDRFLVWATAADVNAGRTFGRALNARRGRHGDAIRFPDDVIAVFDPSYLVSHVARVVTSSAQTFRAPGQAFPAAGKVPPYFAAVARTGSNSPVLPDVRARWIPVLEALDRFGRPRGPVLSLVLPYAGPYAKSAWAFSAHPTLFAAEDSAADSLFVDLCRRLLDPGQITTFDADRVFIKPDEAVTFTAHTVRLPDGTTCRFSSGTNVLAEAVVQHGVARAVCRLPAADADAASGLVRVTAEIRRDGACRDRKETGVVLARSVKGPAFRFADNMFAVDGRRRYFGGMNATGRVWHSDDENPLVWARDFWDMADYGMKALRLLHFSLFARGKPVREVFRRPDSLRPPPCEKTVRQTDALVQLASASHVGIFLTLHDWMVWELEPDELAYQKDWAAYWAGRYAANPGVFYDIQNEPEPARLPKCSFGKSWRDLAARDGERNRARYFARWMKANGDGVHAAAPSAAVTVGNMQSFELTEKHLSTDGIDFMNVHHYGRTEDLRTALKLFDRRFEGKGLSLGEFGASHAHDVRGAGQAGDPSANSIRHFLRINQYAFGLGGAFSCAWCWKEAQDCVFPFGTVWQDGAPKPVLKAYRNLCLLLGEAGASAARPEVFLVLPDSFRIGGGAGRIYRALQKSADALICLNVPFGVINEESLARLPPDAKALVWPMSVCPADETFARVADHVRAGRALLVTGDFRYDADRKPTRASRLAAFGFTADFEPLDPFGTPAAGSAPVQTRGKVRWSPEAVELTRPAADVRALYRGFLDDLVRVRRLKTPGADDGEVIRFAFPLEDGGRYSSVLNTTDVPRTVGSVTLAPGASAWSRHTASGALTSVLLAGTMPGLSVTGAPCGFLSLDGKSLPESRAFAVLPNGPCAIRLARGTDGLVGEIGEFRGRRWRRLGAADGLSVPADETAQDIRLFAAPEARAAAVAALEKLL